MKKFYIPNVQVLYKYLPIIFICIFFTLSLVSAQRESLTFDEIVYLQEGRNAVISRTFDIDPYNPPLAREIAVYPYLLANNFYKSDVFMLQNSLWGRMFILLLAVGLLVLVYLFVAKYVGQKEAIFATFLLTLYPDFLAHSHYVTLDVALTFFIFLAFILFIKLLNKSTHKNILLLSIAIGLGIATKLSFIPYFFMSVVSILFIKYKMQTFFIFKRNIKGLLVGTCIALFVVWFAYLFSWHVIIKQREDASRVSAKITQFAKQHHVIALSGTLMLLETQPVPLGDFIATVKNSALRSLHSESCFFLGAYYSSCRWYFMPINFVLKTPIPLIIFFITSVFIFIKQKKKKELEVCTFVPVAVILVSSILFPLRPLTRYILPLIPFLMICVSFSIEFWMQDNKRKLVFGFLVLWYLLGTAASFPHFLSYANELTFGQKQFVLTDSNIDWGQNLPDISAYVHSHSFKTLNVSYFGRDNGDWYGLQSDKSYGSYKLPDICEFHTIKGSGNGTVTLISTSNWYACGYYKSPLFAKSKIKATIADTIFVFK